ncbi:ABC transporter C family protein (macronuclear) [Tetrahymena thermophila SB210]|uniref:ABC transporter C family protein n=1 Tax=Tetrahymena thermophila (strain SB210) TaxID=312017 RepID=Q241N4_TETTS|nr:ABC transporter C family protein [Tetrahymena thermophila SB210]EAS02536.2 ABC transporter C family protein [Tetrahymena thermophila SB210]|eukprot:XP_001022781.2 ABC transporter C family protein [Tetrahymena thermophila SB210]
MNCIIFIYQKNLILLKIIFMEEQKTIQQQSNAGFEEEQQPLDLELSQENEIKEKTSQKNYSQESQIYSRRNQNKYEQLFQEDSQLIKSKPFDIFMNSSFISKIFTIDMLKVLLRASQDSKIYKMLSTFNLPYLQPKQSIEYNYQIFKANLDAKIQEADRKKRNLVSQDILNVFLKTFRNEIAATVFLNSVGYLCLFTASILINTLISYIQENGVNLKAYGIAFIFNVISISQVLFAHNVIRLNVLIQTRFRNVFMKVIYSKISSLSAFSVKEANVGKLINLISNDLTTLEQRCNIMFAVLSIPLPLVASTIYLYRKYGVIGLIGIVVMLGLCPIQLFFSKLQAKFFSEKTKYTDQRVNLTKEVIEGIRLIKMYAWEEAFVHSIQTIRKLELKLILINILITIFDFAVSTAFSVFSTFLLLYFMYYYGDSSAIDSALLFSTLNLLNFIKNYVVQVIGYGTSGIMQLKVILNRMISVITLQESSMTNIDEQKGQFCQNSILNLLQNGSIQMINFTAFWKQNIPVLQDINVQINNGEFVCIVGKVGSGKTSFLNCILQEVPYYKGQIQCKGQLAYVEQEPYIFSSTVKENILFGREYDDDLYKKIIRACCLEQDLKIFQKGDQTVIGERGMDISGGQKARISLARAIYSQADIYLFDDPISAVDSKVAKAIFFDAISTLCRNSTVILVTHQVHYARFADKIIILEGGKVCQQGKYEELEQTLKNLSNELNHEGLCHQMNLNQENTIQVRTNPYLVQFSKEKSENYDKEEGNQNINIDENQTQSEEENIVVDLKTYYNFFKESGVLIFIPIVLALYAVSDLTYVLFNQRIGDLQSTYEKSGIIKSIGYLVLLYALAQLIKHLSLTIAINRACKKLLHTMICALVRSKVIFFDTTQSGNILNRFSTDIGYLDEHLTKILIDVIEIFIGIIVMFITIMTISPNFIIVALFELTFLVFFLKYCKEGLLKTKQIDLTLRSPLLTFFNLSIQGVLPIKVYQQQSHFEDKFNQLATDSLRASLYYWICQRGFGSFINLFAVFCNSLGIFIVLSTTSSVSDIGQCILYFTTSTEFLQWGIRQLVNLDVSMTNTQRCLNISKLEPEAELNTSYDDSLIKTSKHQKFPTRGELVFQNVRMKYRKELDFVLKGLTFKIQPGKRVGFVGRTGAGKSSVIQALFRMTELEYENQLSNYLNCDIQIDGHSIKKLGLHTLRSGISIIPQNPFIFSGTIRRNLDPLNQYTDDEIYKVLEDVDLLKKVNSLEKNIHEDMSNANDVFSTGQKQLICLGRAILKQSQLIVLDEATANVDMQTDELIQQKIRQRFSNSTLITIAHRLNTIADYDQVIVMDQGQVIEQGTPYELLQNEQGHFYLMVQHTGTKNFELIKNIASQQISKIQK